MSREMKSSHIDTVKDIPEAWGTQRLKYFCSITTGDGDTQDAEREGTYPFYVRSPIIERSTRYTFDGEGILMAGDGAGAGRIFHHAFGKYAVHQRVYRLYNIHGINSNYLFYYIRNLFPNEMDKGSAQSTVPSVRLPMLKDFSICLPSDEEQCAIVRYLDSKCSAIDEAIERHKKIIEKLEEYRKGLVTYVVTHGLNSSVSMKKSGVKWFDTVPEHWNVCRSKYLFEPGEFGIKVGPFGSALRGKMLGEGPYKVYNQAHLINNDFTLSRHFVSADTFEELSSYKIEAGDILFSVMGTIGKCKQMPDGLQQGIMDSHLIKARLNTKVIPAFFEYVYDKDNSDVVMNQLLYLSQGSIMNGLNSTIISNLYLPVPPVREQEEMVSWLDTRCGIIDNMIVRQKDLMTKLEEYRKSIIYNAVTGKIDCREAVK